MAYNKRKQKSVIGSLIILILGLGMVFYGIYNSFLSIAGRDAKAVIISNTYVRKNNANTYIYDVSYAFQVDGNKYTGSGHVAKKMYGGLSGTIKIKYFPINPSLNEPEKDILTSGLLMICCGSFFIFITTKNKKRKRN